MLGIKQGPRRERTIGTHKNTEMRGFTVRTHEGINHPLPIKQKKRKLESLVLAQLLGDHANIGSKSEQDHRLLLSLLHASPPAPGVTFW